MKWRRKQAGARRAYRIAKANGVPAQYARAIAFAASTSKLNQALAFALIEQESGFRHIFGHDAGGPFPGQPVTRERYERLVAHVRKGGTSNGVGLAQITYGGYLLDHPGIWRPLANVKLGFQIVTDAIKANGKREGLARYNGGPTPPAISYNYADSVLSLEAKWRKRFAG